MKPRSLVRALPGVLASVFLVLAAALRAAETDISTLRAKAEKGNAVAQYNLGLAYAEGREVFRDPIEAYVWLSLAAENGTTGKALGALLGAMSADELAAGKARLNERRAAIPTVVAAHPPAPARIVAAAAPAPAEVAAPAPSAPEASLPAADRVAALEEELSALRAVKAKLDQDAASMLAALNGAKAATAAAEQRTTQGILRGGLLQRHRAGERQKARGRDDAKHGDLPLIWCARSTANV